MNWSQHLDQLCRQSRDFTEAYVERLAIMECDEIPEAKWHAYLSTCRAFGYVPVFEQQVMKWAI